MSSGDVFVSERRVIVLGQQKIMISDSHRHGQSRIVETDGRGRARGNTVQSDTVTIDQNLQRQRR